MIWSNLLILACEERMAERSDRGTEYMLRHCSSAGHRGVGLRVMIVDHCGIDANAVPVA